MNWNYIQPVEILFGMGRSSEIGAAAQKLGCKKGLLVSDPFFVQSGLTKKLMEQSGGYLAGVFSEVSPNPDVTEVDACAEVLRMGDYDFVVALGGGSAMDCAKAASMLCLTGDSIRRYHGTGEAVPPDHLPLIALPTTAGTGSEVTCVSVLTDHANGKKSPIVSDAFYPRIALIDPALTCSMPPHVTAGTGIDVLSHALEGYWSRGHQPVCDACALHAARLVLQYLPIAYREPDNLEAREKMCEASVIAGLAFTLPKTTASHACSFPLTNLHHIPHGEACGLTLDWFLRINAAHETDGRIRQLCQALGFADAEALADHIHALKAELGLRNNLSDLQLSDAQIDELVRISRHPNLYNNPVEITDEMLYEMYRAMR